MTGDPTRGIEMRSVGLTLGGSRVFDGLDLVVEPGDMFALVGEAGSGKTAFLKLIAGLLKPTAGEVRVLGADLGALRGAALLRHTQRIGLVIREPRLVPYLTVGEQVARPLRPDPTLGLRETRRRVADLLEVVGIPGTEDRYPPELAPALYRRVALARAVAARPPILLCDAPTAGLAPRESETVRQLLRRLHERLRLTTVVATRDVGAAFDVADRVAVLAEGRIAWDRSAARGETAATGRVTGGEVRQPALS